MKTLLVSLLLVLLSVSPVWAETALEAQLARAGENASELRAFVDRAAEEHGDLGERAAGFLIQNMPERDLTSLSAEFLLENLSLALHARSRFSWAAEVPEDVFLNDVLPYASLDETREPWRKQFLELCAPLVKDCKTATEAAQALNREFFDVVNVHYDTGRKAPNQSPSESMELGMATCTGLSIILVDACRSVGVPARIAGTALWANKRGNHTWVEIHDGGTWYFTGADEYDAKGLDRGWFTGDASKAIAEDWRHAIWATSWKATGSHFPMVWDLEDHTVPAVNVTERYAKADATDSGRATVYLRAWNKAGGERLELDVDLLDGSGDVLQSVRTRAGTADLNDMPSFSVLPGSSVLLRVTRGDVARAVVVPVKDATELTQDLIWDELPTESVEVAVVRAWLGLSPREQYLSVPKAALSREDAAAVTELLWEHRKAGEAEARKAELDAKVVKAAGKEMRYLERTFGSAEEGRRSLFISLHGGGGAPARINDQQWQNQIRLYAPEEGIVVAPRAPTNTWNLWHEGHVDDLLDRLIGNFVLHRGVDPDRVYLLGYSAGGDGVYQLAPRMADRFAAASMMAGHPNDASPLGLRNLPFAIFMGGEDGAYDRNKVARRWGDKLAALRDDDPDGYEHRVTIYEGLGHWMKGKDAEALPWMRARSRDPWPKHVVWHQSGRTHTRFYWLGVPSESAQRGRTVRAAVDGQRIEITAEGLDRLSLRLSDELLDLDQPVVVVANGEEVFSGTVRRNLESIWGSVFGRADPRTVAPATLELDL